MLSDKPHVDFDEFDLTAGWEAPPGYPHGITRKILANARENPE